MGQIKVHDTRRIGKKGREIFEALNPELEPEHKGKFVAIDVDSGDYFLGDTMTDASNEAKEKYPDKISYLARIGHKAAISSKGPVW